MKIFSFGQICEKWQQGIHPQSSASGIAVLFGAVKTGRRARGRVERGGEGEGGGGGGGLHRRNLTTPTHMRMGNDPSQVLWRPFQWTTKPLATTWFCFVVLAFLH